MSTQLTMLVHTICLLAVSCSSVVTSSPIFDSPEIVKYSVTGDVQSPSLLSEVESRGHVTKYDVTNNAMNATSLVKRQCVWSPTEIEGGDYVCDFNYPTISEMVDRIQDTNDEGRATGQRSVFFYTNLREPTDAEYEEVEKAMEKAMNGKKIGRVKWAVHGAWIASWMKAKNIDHYSAFDAIKTAWKVRQGSWVEEWTDYMENPDDPKPYGGSYNIFKNCFLQAVAFAAINPDAYLFTTKGQNWDPRSVWATVEYWMLTTNPNIQRIHRVDPTPGACDSGELLWERGRDEQVAPGMTSWICPVQG